MHCWLSASSSYRIFVVAEKIAYAYFLTSSGFAAKSSMALNFLQIKMAEYERLRAEIEQLQLEIEAVSGMDLR